MKSKNRNLSLKKQSKENEQRCWEALRLLSLIHPRTVVIDATLSDDGTPNFCAYSVDDTKLRMFGSVLINQEKVRTAILNSEAGSGAYRLTDGNESEATMATLGNEISLE